MLITGIKSRPVYETLTPFERGTVHLVVGQGGGGAAMLRLLRELKQGGTPASRIRVMYSTQSFSGVSHLAELERECADELGVFVSNAALVDGLRNTLDAAHMGLRLYLSGSESFIGNTMQVASEFNLNRDEVKREHNGTFVRRVWCVHCDARNEDVTRRVFRCGGCGLDLIVRDHYSTRMAAFMGVKFDAEQTGAAQPDEELDT
ncbi:MAG TPA: dimethylamine monooxygenase subunit DmmA family protein [Paraburkholderia sp.]|jgi:ferredoxin-NADP reductase|uniref:dimethylamine monooxygenase subunit DmmA family protein n=1 Tax=Paraburkholderia sp. TaxID=1926495 RepID=UPI002DF6F399|nr:dimethylamine monooxygenase subunit DmmA family protein [Paraburkholderia sp.]